MILYRTRQLTYPGLTGVFVVLIIVPLYLAYHYQLGYTFKGNLCLLVAIVNLFYLINFNHLTITLTPQQLNFGFGLFSKKIPLANIFYWQTADLSDKKITAVGIRRLTGHQTVYLAKGHRSIDLKTVVGHFYLTCNQPQILIDKITEAKKLLNYGKN
ncbi:MAG: hypothetical protein WCW02_02585 [Candidatus Buchananbacteria bacterium]